LCSARLSSRFVILFLLSSAPLDHGMARLKEPVLIVLSHAPVGRPGQPPRRYQGDPIGFTLARPAKELNEAVDLIVVTRIGEPEELTLEVRQPGGFLRDENATSFDRGRL